MTQIALNRLTLSPENARKRHDKAGLESLAASLKTHGQLYPLLIRPNGKAGAFQVDDGGRRLAAFQLLAKAGDIKTDHPVECQDHTGAAAEISLVANIERTAFHPAEEVAQFAKLAKEGSTSADIAARFGIPERRVRQRLALGSLSPKVLQAWQDEKIDAQTAEAFTLARDAAEQERVLKGLRGYVNAWQVREKLGVGSDHNDPTPALLTYIGKDAYKEAGGAIVEDLFGDADMGRNRHQDRVIDKTLLQKLAGEKLAAKCATLIKAGWSWASPRGELDGYQEWDWAGLPKGKNCSKEEKAKSGCVLSIARSGQLEIRYGVVKPKPGAKKSSAPGATRVDKLGQKKTIAPAVPKALMTRVSQQATEAARIALAEEPRLGLCALLAAFNSDVNATPIKVEIDDSVMGHKKAWNAYGHTPSTSDKFEKNVDLCLAMSDAEIIKAASAIAVMALDVRTLDGRSPLADHCDAALLNRIDPGRLNKALRDRFDAADFFKSVSGAEIKKAIVEAIGELPAQAGAMKKAELVTYAVDKIPATGWLPNALRTAHYDGPGAKVAKPAPAKKATKRPAKKAPAKKAATAKKASRK